MKQKKISLRKIFLKKNLLLMFVFFGSFCLSIADYGLRLFGSQGKRERK